MKTDAVAKEKDEQDGGSGTAPGPSSRLGPRPSAANRHDDDDEDDRRYEGDGIVADDDEY